MASWSPPVLHATADDFSVTDNNTLANNETFLYQAPYILAWNTSTSSGTTGTNFQITLGGLVGSGYGFSVSSNNVVLPLTGIYECLFAVQVGGGVGSGGNYLNSFVEQNGSSILQGAVIGPEPTFPLSPGGGLIIGTAGDLVGLWLANNSGSNLGTQANANSTFLHLVFRGSQ